MVLALNELMILKRKVNAHLDRSDLHSEKLHTILSILQQLEAKIDLIFSHSPPVPGETIDVEDDIGEGFKWVNTMPASPFPTLEGKVSSIVPTKKNAGVVAKKKGRPKKAPKD